MKKIAVVGAGNMGSGIAQKAATEGFEVVLVDMNQAALDRGFGTIKKFLQEGIERRIFTPESAEAVSKRITPTLNFSDAADVDVAIEAVFEDEAVKGKVFSQLDAACGPKTILATNTSSILVTRLATSTKRPDRFVGLHFFYHPAKNRLLEVIPGERTSAETLQRSVLLARLLGKVAIVCKDRPGFVVNRFFVPWLNEAVRLLEEGVADVATIEAIAKDAFKIGMGPFELMNVTGVPIALHASGVLAKDLGAFYAASLRLKSQVDGGAPWGLAGSASGDAKAHDIIRERLLGVVFGIAASIVDEGICSAEDVDRGAKVGLRWEQGPFEMMNACGVSAAMKMVNVLKARHGNFPVSSRLTDQVAQGAKPWTLRTVDLAVNGTVATITLNRPEASNAINEALMRDLDEAVTAANQHPAVEAIILEGAGKAFGAGADVGLFVKAIEGRRIPDIVTFSRFGHSVLKKLDESPKRVIVKLHGPAIGGGAEIAITADLIVGTEKAQMGFPETGLGIYPGLGGTQRLPRLVGKSLARYLILVGDILDAKKAVEVGMVAQVVPVAELDIVVERLARNAEAFKVMQTLRGTQSAPWVHALESLFADGTVDSVLAGQPKNGHLPKEWIDQILKKLSRKAPLALKTAQRLISEGFGIPLPQALNLELDALPAIFASKDALEGLSSLLQKRRPTFTGV